jgi:poly(hydroxyalkanoate) depolymerase family esterase
MKHITRTLLHLTMASTLAAGACAPAGTAEPAATPAPVAQPAPAASSWEWVVDNPASGTRRYRLFIPAGYEPWFPPPLVVMLHGCTQDPDDFARGTRFNALAESAGAMVVYPEQPATRNPQKCWNWYQADGAGEPAWIAAVTREVMGRYAVDRARVYIAGVSAGGAMAVNTAAAYPDLYAAVGVHSGIPYGAATDLPSALAAMRSGPANPDALAEPARAILRAAGRDWLPMIVFHGAADAVVNAENGRRLAAQWAQAGGARDFLRSEEEIGGLTVVKDRFGPATELWMVQGLGHAWSGGSPEGTYTDERGPDASREMLRFFLSHPRG